MTRISPGVAPRIGRRRVTLQPVVPPPSDAADRRIERRPGPGIMGVETEL